MIDPRRTGALTAFLVDRLESSHGGEIDTTEPGEGLPPDLTTVLLGDLPIYITPDVGEPATNRAPLDNTVLLSACLAIELVDRTTADFILHQFRSDTTLPADLKLWTSVGEVAQVWVDRMLVTDTSFEVAAASLDEFVDIARRLRAAVAPVDMSSSPEARERGRFADFGAPVSFDLIDQSEWAAHPWLSRLEQNSDYDGMRHHCLYDLPPGAARLFAEVRLEFELVDGTWESIDPELPGPIMPAQGWRRPDVAWFDAPQWRTRDGRPDSPTGRWRARVPTGWSGPPV